MIVPFPESSLNDEAGKNFMKDYDEYARRAKLMAGVHGMTCWSSGASGGHCAAAVGGKSEGSDVSDNDGEGKMKAVDHGLPNGSSDKNNPANNNAKLGKMGSRSNIVRPGSKNLDKKAKKKSLRRL